MSEEKDVRTVYAEATAAEVCPSCNGTRYTDDENWQGEYPGQKRTWHDGRIPCGACNEGGWEVPDGAEPA